MDLSLARYFLKWSWLSSTASSRTLLFLSGIACVCRGKRFKFGSIVSAHCEDTREDKQNDVDQERFPVTGDKDI